MGGSTIKHLLNRTNRRRMNLGQQKSKYYTPRVPIDDLHSDDDWSEEGSEMVWDEDLQDYVFV